MIYNYPKIVPGQIWEVMRSLPDYEGHLPKIGDRFLIRPFNPDSLTTWTSMGSMEVFTYFPMLALDGIRREIRSVDLERCCILISNPGVEEHP
jgi:hypothetical protein